MWKILHEHHEDFKCGYDEHCEKQYGFVRWVAEELVKEYLRFGGFHEGFDGVRCTDAECRLNVVYRLETNLFSGKNPIQFATVRNNPQNPRVPDHGKLQLLANGLSSSLARGHNANDLDVLNF